ncbi:MAG TPA: VOC family protein [Gammaproteobacteria bacterium]|nr:VOC family protein [Gammaproteobacteria bacterium]HIK71399.1 VOC family protein [Pseudomonadales bacterium]
MELAKPYIDVGIQTNQRDAMLDFWGRQVGLPYEELLKVGGGNHQHRHSLNGSVFKLNHLRDELPSQTMSGYNGLLIASDDIEEPVTLYDPDRNRVTLIPEGEFGVDHIGIELEVSSIAAFQHFYRRVLRIEEVAENCFKWGTTLLFLEENPGHQPCLEMRGVGFRYITVQVWDVDEEYRGFIDRGGSQGSPPRTLGTTARISFVRDPDGNWIEISQRASLTGDLP